MKVALLEPAPVDHGWYHARVCTPHLGAPILAGIAKAHGHECLVHSEFVGPIEFDSLTDVDVFGVSVNTGLTHQRGYEIATALRNRFPHTPLIAGGHHATLNPEEAAHHFDYVVRGYAESAFPNLLREISAGAMPIRTPAITYRDQETGRLVHNPAESLVPIEATADLDSIAGYREANRRSRYSVERYAKFLPLSFHSRGCALSCADG